jgi:hypothetical protein
MCDTRSKKAEQQFMLECFCPGPKKRELCRFMSGCIKGKDYVGHICVVCSLAVISCIAVVNVQS